MKKTATLLIFIVLFNQICAQSYPQCNRLRMAQYVCDSPQVAEDTDDVKGCTPEGIVKGYLFMFLKLF
jgi:hypothetical protein